MSMWNPEYGGEMAERGPRSSYLFKVDCTNEEGHIVLIRVRNLSATGMGAVSETGVGFLDGEKVLTHFAGVRKVPGKVIWVRGKSFGVTFDHIIDPDLIARSIERPGADFTPDPRHQVKGQYRRPGLMEVDL